MEAPESKSDDFLFEEMRMEDLVELRQVAGLAYFNDPGFVWSFSDESWRRSALEWLYECVIWMKLITGGRGFVVKEKTGRIVGCVCITTPTTGFITTWTEIKAGVCKFPFKIGWQGYRRMRCLDHTERSSVTQVVTESGLVEVPPKGQERKYFWLNHLFVHPDLQSRGIGSKLVRYALEQVLEGPRREEFAKMPVFVDTMNPRNLEFYQKLGFQLSLSKHVVEDDTTTPTMFTLTLKR